MSQTKTIILTQNTRNANLDILRIFSMFLIVLLHSVDHTGVLEAVNTAPILIGYYTQVIFALTRVSVNCYVLLSGFFMVKSQFHLKKLISLWITVSFYSFFIKLVFMLFDTTTVSIPSLLSSFFSITTGRYWFITIYFGLYILSPFLNRIITALTEKQHLYLLFTLFVLLSVLVSIHPSIAGMNSGDGWGLTWFVFLYLTSAWFRLYYKPTKKKYIYIAMYITISVIVGSALYVSDYFGVSILSKIFSNWYRYDSVPVYIASVCLFLFFVNCNIKKSTITKTISKISALTLGVYLIHAHPQLSPYIWKKINLPQYMNLAYFPFIQLLICVSIFVLCIAIDYIKSLIFIPIEKQLNKSRTIAKFNNYIISKIS